MACLSKWKYFRITSKNNCSSCHICLVSVDPLNTEMMHIVHLKWQTLSWIAMLFHPMCCTHKEHTLSPSPLAKRSAILVISRKVIYFLISLWRKVDYPYAHLITWSRDWVPLQEWLYEKLWHFDTTFSDSWKRWRNLNSFILSQEEASTWFLLHVKQASHREYKSI